MSPCLPIPRAVTVLYIFAVVNLTVMLNLSLVGADIIVLDKNNTTIEDLPAQFGDPIPEEGLLGRVLFAEPHDGCHKLDPPPEAKKNSSVKWIALIRRKDCDFDVKVLNAQMAGFHAAIVHNVGSDKLVTMHGGALTKEVKIPSVFISETDGVWLEEMIKKHKILTVIIDDHVPLNANLYLLPFAIVVGICFVVMVVFMIVKWILNIRRKRRSRLSKANLNKIPIKKFKKGDPYDVCAICLDEYEEDEKLRVLPCAHAYHQKCIDPWLTKNKRTCPLCKKKVIPGDPDSSSDEDTDEDTHTGDSETTPLLAANNNTRGQARGGNTFDNSGLPSAVREDVHPFPGSDSDSSSYNEEGSEVLATSPSLQQSSVEVHETPRLHRRSYPPAAYGLFAPSPNEDAQEKISVSSQTSGNIDDWLRQVASKEENASSSSESEGSHGQGCHGNQPQREAEEEELLGAVGGVSNRAFEIVEDHFNVDSSGKNKKRKKRRPSPKEEIEVHLVTGKGNIQEGDEDDRLLPV